MLFRSEAVARVANGSATYTPQDESRASFQGLVDDTAGRIDWSRSAAEIDCQIRGCDPNPGAHARLGAQTVRLFGATLAESFDIAAPPGTVIGVDAKGARIAAKGGVLHVAKLKLGSGAKLAAAESGITVGAQLSNGHVP